uniref:phosphogluconate dehydrogenase (NADP(+)-dependent, decarboxylating) n=1 Tax=Fagus sylvatica TaxID=28930 RepID=A0A2N9GL23_FAGSY
MAAPSKPTRIGLAGLAIMGQNLALNIAEKGFPISVYNRTTSKVDETVERAKQEGDLPAGAPVDQTIKTLSAYMEKGGEEGARNGPSLMPGGSFEAYKYIEDILLKVAAQVRDCGPCVTYIGNGGSDIFGIKDDKGEGYLVDKVLDKTGMKGTGKWTIQQAAELSVAAPTIESSLDARFLSGLKEERVKVALKSSNQGMNLIRIEKGWDLKLGELARIWKGGCIIRAIFLDRIKQAYDRNPDLASLLVDPEFAKEIIE